MKANFRVQRISQCFPNQDTGFRDNTEGFLEALDVSIMLECAPSLMPTNLESQPQEFDGSHCWRRHLSRICHCGVKTQCLDKKSLRSSKNKYERAFFIHVTKKSFSCLGFSCLATTLCSLLHCFKSKIQKSGRYFWSLIC